MHGYYLMHYGVSAEDGSPGRGSGRYPLGSGKRPFQGKLSKAGKFIAKTAVEVALTSAISYGTIYALGTLGNTIIDRIINGERIKTDTFKKITHFGSIAIDKSLDVIGNLIVGMFDISKNIFEDYAKTLERVSYRRKEALG